MDDHTSARSEAPFRTGGRSEAPLPEDDLATQARPRRGRGRPLVILLAILLVVGLFLWRPWAHRAVHAGAAPPQPVAVATIASGDIDVVLTELGTVTPLATVIVQSQISGYLQQVLFHEGQDVRRGDLLALVDPRPYQVLLEQYQAQILRDTAALHSAQMDLTRYQLLGRQDSIAKQTVEDQVYTVAQDQATVRIDQSQIDSEKLNITYCHIVSPVDGRVGLRQVDAGNFVTSALTNGLLVVTEIKPISVIFTVAEDDIQPILDKLHGQTRLAVDAYDRTDTTRIASGTVETIDNQVDTSTGTVKLRAIFPNDDERLFPNEFVNAHLLLQTLHGALIVPTPAVQNGPQGNFVYLVRQAPAASGRQAGTIEARPQSATVAVRQIHAGYAHGDRTVVTSGLAAGDQVVIDGTDRLHDGAAVVIPHAPEAAPASTHGDRHAG